MPPKDFSSLITRPKLIGIIVVGMLVFMGVQSFASAQEPPLPNLPGATTTTQNIPTTTTQRIPTTTTAQAGTTTTTAPQPEGEAILGKLENITEKGEKMPVSGIKISVYQGNTLIGEDISNSGGDWIVEVPSAGNYRVTLDTSTLPDGINLTDPDKQELSDLTVRNGQSKRVIFKLGEGASSTTSRVDRVSNLVLSGLRFGAIIAMAAVGLSLIYSVTNIVNFAHGELITMGALVSFFLTTSGGGPGWHLLIAAVPAIVLVGILSSSMELGVWKPLRKKGVNHITLMIISIGFSLILRYLYLIVFGSQARALDDYAIQDTISFLSFTTTPKTLWIIGISIIILLGIGLFLLLTKHGTTLRALSDNSSLTKASGINIDTAILIAWLVGSITTALSGILLGVTQGVDWEMGWQFLLLVFAATILGGTKSVFGAMIGGLIIGVATELSTYWIGPEFKFAVALGLMAAVLLWRPQGVLGWKVRVA